MAHIAPGSTPPLGTRPHSLPGSGDNGRGAPEVRAPPGAARATRGPGVARAAPPPPHPRRPRTPGRRRRRSDDAPPPRQASPPAATSHPGGPVALRPSCRCAAADSSSCVPSRRSTAVCCCCGCPWPVGPATHGAAPPAPSPARSAQHSQLSVRRFLLLASCLYATPAAQVPLNRPIEDGDAWQTRRRRSATERSGRAIALGTERVCSYHSSTHETSAVLASCVFWRRWHR